MRIAVTGLGCVTPLGADKTSFFGALMEGRDGVSGVTAFDVSGYGAKTAGEIRALPPLPAGARLPRGDRAAHLLMLAVEEAWADSELRPHEADPPRVALITGTTLGGTLSGERFYRALLHGQGKVHPADVLAGSQYAPNDAVMAHWGLSGPSVVISTACSASAHAIGTGMELLREGSVDVVLAGGVEPLSELTFAGFGILRSMTPEKIRPFDKSRKGLVLGEGAGVLVLERESGARRRGARIYAWAAGYGSSSDAYHMTAPDKEGRGAARAMEMALRDAALSADMIDYVSAHGTGTPANDAAETNAIKRVLGGRAHEVPISSIKSMFGHTLGAAGAIEALATVLSVYRDAVPPTINYETPDPACDLDCVPNEGRQLRVRAAFKNSFGFGGNNAALVFSKAE